MRYLILSDVHANWEALQAVLAHTRETYDEILCCGDIVGYGADPDRVTEWMRGNVDHIVRGKDELKAYFNQFLGSVTIERVISTDNFTETEDTLMFEATVESNRGVVKTFDALVLESGRIRLQFTGVR